MRASGNDQRIVPIRARQNRAQHSDTHKHDSACQPACSYLLYHTATTEIITKGKNRTVLTVPEMDPVCLTLDENVAGAHDGPELSG